MDGVHAWVQFRADRATRRDLEASLMKHDHSERANSYTVRTLPKRKT